MSEHKIIWWMPQIGATERQLVNQVLDSNYVNEGELATQLEEKMAALLGTKYAIATTSGTIAIFLALKGLGIGHGDEVIVPDVTFVATANAVILTGAKPILVDVYPHNLNIDVERVEQAITPKTKAIVPVHVTGRAADMEKILEVAKKHNLFVVEDAAEGLLSKHKGKYLGTFGNAGCFSFSPNKTITTGQGGIVVTNDEKLCTAIREIKDHGRPKRGTGGDDLHNVVGFNFKFTNLQAAVGLGQINYLQARTARMKEIYKEYSEQLKNIKGFDIFKCDVENGESPQWTDALVDRRDELDKYLREHNIDCRRYWFPIHSQKPYELSDDNFPVSKALCQKAIWLPSCFSMTTEDVKLVCQKIKDFYLNK